MRTTDIHINGFNFTSGLLALSVLDSGLTVSTDIGKTDLSTDFVPEPTNLFPFNAYNLRKSRRQQDFISQLSALFPHLFYPVRTVSFKNQHQPNNRYISFVDKLLKRDRESATFPFNTEKYRDYQNFDKLEFSKGILTFEFRFDRNRAIIELLKLCKQKGLIITENVNSTLKINATPFDKSSRYYKLDKQLSVTNQVNLQDKNNSISLLKINGEDFIYIHNYNTEQDINRLVQQAGIHEKIKLNLTQKYPDHVIVDYSLADLKHGYRTLEKRISQLIEKRISIGAILPNRPSNFRFKQLHEACDDYYNMAKQTGISVQQFNSIYFRYPKQIEWMTERAYEQLNKERDPLVLWKNVEHAYLEEELSALFTS